MLYSMTGLDQLPSVQDLPYVGIPMISFSLGQPCSTQTLALEVLSITMLCEVRLKSLPVIHCQRVPILPIQSGVVVHILLPLAVQVVGHHVDAVKVAADL